MHEHRARSIVIAAACVTFLATLPFTLPAAIYLVLSVYALVKGIGSGTNAPSAVTIFVAIVLLVSAFVAMLAGAIVLIGRPMTPRRRRVTDLDAGPELEELGI